MSQKFFGIEGHGVGVEIDSYVAEISLQRPAKRNALDQAMLANLEDALDFIDQQDAVKVVLLTGQEKTFCAGGDILAWSDLQPISFAHHWIRRGHRIFNQLAQFRCPVIAILNGNAYGGGFELAACADFRVAETHANIGLPETSLGVVPGWSGTQRATQRFGAQLIRRMAIGAEVFPAEVALQLGLVDRIAETGNGGSVARAWAQAIAARDETATSVSKLLINIASGEEVSGSSEALASAFISTTPGCKDGVERFRSRKNA